MRPKQSLSPILCLVVAAVLSAVQPARCQEVSQFHLAVAKGELAKVKQLLSSDPTLLNHRNEYKFTPLFQAAIAGRTSVAKLLLDRGAKIEARVLGQTPLYAACDNGHSETAALLLDQGADPNAVLTGKDADAYARSGEETPLGVAIHGFHKEAVKTLLDHGANTNLTAEEYKAAAKNPRKQPRQIPLHAVFQNIRHACHWKNLKKGDKARVAELDRLIKAGKDIARILITHQKTDVTARHPHGGGVALHLAAMFDFPDLAILMLARGVDVNVRTTKTPWDWHQSRPPDYAFNETPLHLAVRAGHEEMVNLLLKHGADRGAISSLGRTPYYRKAAGKHMPTRTVNEIASRYLKSIVKVDSSAKVHWESPDWASTYLGDALLAPTAPDEQSRMKGLRLEVEFKKRDYLLGEPLLIRCSLINDSPKPIVLSYGSLAEQKNTFFFEITGPDGKPVPWQSPTKIDSFGPQPLPIPSGQRYVAWFNLVDHYNLTQAGEFAITMRYESDGRSFDAVSVEWRDDLWKGKLTQKLGSLKIIEPTLPADKVALKDLLATARYGAESPFYFLYLFHAEKFPDKFDKFLGQHSDSRYAAYARYGNALRAIDRFARTGRKAFAEAAIPYLEAINPADYPPLFAERRLFHLIQAHVAADSKPDRIDALVQKFLADFPRSPYAHLLRIPGSKPSGRIGGTGGEEFIDVPNTPSLLMGFEYTVSTLYGGHLTIKSLRPISRTRPHTRTSEILGKWHGVPHGKILRVKAKEAYVVTGIIAKGGHRLDGFRVVFTRIKNGQLNPDDSYESCWLGGRGGGPEVTLSGNGNPIIGIHGRHGADIDAIGLVQTTAQRASGLEPVR